MNGVTIDMSGFVPAIDRRVQPWDAAAVETAP